MADYNSTILTRTFDRDSNEPDVGEHVHVQITIDLGRVADYVADRMKSHYWKDSVSSCKGAIKATIITKELFQL